MVPLFDFLVALKIKAMGGSILTQGGVITLLICFSIKGFEVLRYLRFMSTLKASTVKLSL